MFFRAIYYANVYIVNLKWMYELSNIWDHKAVLVKYYSSHEKIWHGLRLHWSIRKRNNALISRLFCIFWKIQYMIILNMKIGDNGMYRNPVLWDLVVKSNKRQHWVNLNTHFPSIVLWHSHKWSLWGNTVLDVWHIIETKHVLQTFLLIQRYQFQEQVDIATAYS